MKRLIRICGLIALISTISVPSAFADDLTRIIQEDLAALGYDTGGVDGEMTMATAIAISKFQAENSLEVTGEATPQLAGIIKATATPQLKADELPAYRDVAALQAAQQACLEAKVNGAQQSQKKKRGIGSLMRAVSRTAAQIGGVGTSSQVAKLSTDVYEANATATDLKQAAKDLGLTEDELESCRNP